MITYTKENHKEIISGICGHIQALVENENISQLTKQLRLKLSTFRNIISKAGADSPTYVSLETLADVMFSLRGKIFRTTGSDGRETRAFVAKIVVRIGEKTFTLQESGKQQIADAFERHIEAAMKRHRHLSNKDICEVLAISEFQRRKVKLGKAKDMLLSSMFDIFTNHGIPVYIGLVDTQYTAEIDPVTKDITQTSNPTIATTKLIADGAKQYAESRSLSAYAISKRCKLPEQDIEDFLNGNPSRRFPLSFAVSVANACGATVSITVN